VAAHGGTVVAEGMPGGGSEFVMDLPDNVSPGRKEERGS
jgi:signal transduction histidine kinase